eukprot:gene13997-18539_t
MLSPPPLASPRFDLTVRVGCSLVYEVTGTASLLLNVQPRPNRDHAIVFEALSIGHDLRTDRFTDAHGNAVRRVHLARGTNSIRHDAIVAVSSLAGRVLMVGGTPVWAMSLARRWAKSVLAGLKPICGITYVVTGAKHLPRNAPVRPL